MVVLTTVSRAITLALLVAATPAPSAAQHVWQGDAPPTFHTDVAPIVRAKCTVCHQRNGDGPFALESYDEVRRRASTIAEVIASGYMPPWKAAAESAAFLGDRRLLPSEKSLIQQWLAAGMPEGVADQTALPPHPASAWVWGPPDVIIELPQFLLPAGSSDVFRNFVVAVPFDGTKYVRAFQFRPRSGAVHHANIRVDATPASAELDLADPAPGYEGVILHSAEYPEGQFLGWTPGQAAPPADDLAWPLVGRSHLVVQLHLRSTGRAEQVSPLLGLYFAAAPPRIQPTMIRLGRQDLKLHAGQKRYRSVDSLVAPVAMTVTAIQPHAHQRARNVSLVARLPNGSRRTLLRIDDWDFRWQDQYRLATPLRLPAGTTLESVFQFDNSNDNPRNPSYPAQDVTWGWRTSDEMADIWVQVLTDSDEARMQLTRLARRKATAEDAIGAEVLVAREPAHFNLRNDAALIYLELGQPARALEHFAAARTLKPEAPATAFNVGVALEALGRVREAVNAYRAAMTLDRTYVPARLRLGALRAREGSVQDAIALYQEALRFSPGDAGARCDLARLLAESGQPTRAIDEYNTAVAAEAGNVGCLINFTWLLAAHDDERIRQPERAIQLGEHAVQLSRRLASEPLALDALAAAYASAGSFSAAVATAERAIALTADDRQRAAMHVRVALYRNSQAFRVSGGPTAKAPPGSSG